jgi:hypothetical protein
MRKEDEMGGREHGIYMFWHSPCLGQPDQAPESEVRPTRVGTHCFACAVTPTPPVCMSCAPVTLP